MRRESKQSNRGAFAPCFLFFTTNGRNSLTICSFGFLVLLSFSLCGCGETPNYPEHIQYPIRKDRIVVRIPTIEVDQLESSGDMELLITEIDDKGGQTQDPNSLSESKKRELSTILTGLFGTPAKPLVTGDPDIDGLAKSLYLDGETLAQGSPLFRRHCQQCHGLSGDGRGPTGPWIWPHPRDFRLGIFKYVSTSGSGSRKPAREDLERTLYHGIKGTAMPSFAQMPEADREKIIRYITHLSLRGQVEKQLLLLWLSEGEDAIEGELTSKARSLLKRYLQDWQIANQERIQPQSILSEKSEQEILSSAHQESIRRGYQLFSDPKGIGCLNCHVDFGRQAKFRYDDWGTLVRPADLTKGIYHGGTRPIDHFWRIRGGIGPSQMPAATSLTEEQVWDLVLFVEALPFPKQLPTEIRNRVYPEIGK
jgi:mono/diheme cytochrome c family protein